MSGFIDELKLKAEVARDLINQGAEEVEINGVDLKVVKTRSTYDSSTGPIQVVNVSAQSTANSESGLILQMHIIRKELEEKFSDTTILKQIKENLDSLERELKKKKPDKRIIKKIINWAIDTGWEVFVKLVPVILDKLKFIAP